MARPRSRHPTQVELEILNVIWRDGPSTVRQMRDALAEHRDLAYTSVMTMMTIMTDKGYLRRRKKGGSFVYRAKSKEGATKGGMLKDLMDRAFDGRPEAVMVNLLETSDLEADELKRLRDLIDKKVKEEGR